MIDASPLMPEKSSATPRSAKKMENVSQDFLGHMTSSSEKNSPKAQKSSEAPKEKTNDDEEEEKHQSSDATPVATGVVDDLGQARKKMANILEQRAKVLNQMSSGQDSALQKQLAAVEKTLDLDKMNDDLLGKLVEKLSLDKSKGDLNFQNRLMLEKTLMNLDASDTLNTRLEGQTSDKSVLLNALNGSDRINAAASLSAMKMSIPIGNPDWGVELGKRIQMLLKNNIQQAEIRMDPPELGRIQIRINLSQEQANISFTALNPNVREAIEANMTRLREMLSETGLQLGETDVGGEFQEEANSRTDEFQPFSERRARYDEPVKETPSMPVYHSVDGVIDYFA